MDTCRAADDNVRTAAQGSTTDDGGCAAMPTLSESELDRRHHALDVRDAELTRRELALGDFSKQLTTQHERLRALRADLLQQLGGQRRSQPTPRWPSGPRVTATLVDEDQWWLKMLGREARAA
jgi:hypothetical protein